MNFLEELELALREEAAHLRDSDPGTRPDRADIRVADAFDKLADNIRYRAAQRA